MKPTSARSLMWASLVLLLVGGMVGSPAAGVAGAVLAALCAIAPVVFGTKGVRVAGVLLLLASVGLAVALLPAVKGHMDGYRNRAHRAQESVTTGTTEAK